MAWNKEFRLPRMDAVPVWEVKVAGYGTVIVEEKDVQKAGGEVKTLLHRAGINTGLVDGMQRGTRTREYLDNLPAISPSN